MTFLPSSGPPRNLKMTRMDSSRLSLAPAFESQVYKRRPGGRPRAGHSEIAGSHLP